MGSVQPELSLDFNPSFVPTTISDFLKELSLIENGAERVSKLDDFVKKLEDEMKKVDAFKRELPLLIQALKVESVDCQPLSNTKPVLEEFLPLNKVVGDSRTKKDIDCKDKKNWMSSLQLGNGDNHDSLNDANGCEGDNRYLNEELLQSQRYGRDERASMSFKAHSGFPTVVGRSEEKEESLVHGLPLFASAIKPAREQLAYSASKTGSQRVVGSSPTIVKTNTRMRSQEPEKKQRRCWSPELHRRFVNALQQLGGAQVATPKQIRELMQVDGLTNDEVKSHLQKYRLHIRRLRASTATQSSQSQVAVSGLWMSQDHYGDSSKASSSQSASPEGPLQLAGNGGRTSTTGDSMEDDEGEKCDSHSW